MSAQARSTRTEPTRLRVVRAAVELMAEQGYTGTSIDEVAERAGVAKGTVFYNFGSKEGLFEAVLRHGAGELVTALRTAIGDRTGQPALDALVRAVLETLREAPAWAQLVAAELYRTQRPWQSVLREVRDEVGSVVAEVLAGMRATASEPLDVDPAVVAPALVGALLAVALDWLAFAPQRPLEEVHRTALAMIAGRSAGAHLP